MFSWFLPVSRPISTGSSYYASKPCSYTDASGRPVAPPRPPRQEKPEDHRAIQPASTSRPPIHARDTDPSEDLGDKNYYHAQSRKRFRNERGDAVAAETINTASTLPMMDAPLPQPTERPPPMELDHPLTRELTNRKFPPSLSRILLNAAWR
jgi:hypothetical protein